MGSGPGDEELMLRYGGGDAGAFETLYRRQLPEAQREAFLLQQEGELSVEEIGAATGVSRETAKSRLRYALAKLRASLGSELES